MAIQRRRRGNITEQARKIVHTQVICPMQPSGSLLSYKIENMLECAKVAGVMYGKDGGMTKIDCTVEAGDFPAVFSLTITNRCNLRCRMCGQWGESGYMKDCPDYSAELEVDVWKRLMDEIADNGGRVVLLRGGEPLLYPGFFELAGHAKSRNLYLCVDCNGTLLAQHAKRIVSMGIDQFHISIDGPEHIHDDVRGVEGGFGRIRDGIRAVHACEAELGRTESCVKVAVNVISGYSCKGLPDMPDTVCSLNIPLLAIVPFYYMDRATGLAHEAFMQKHFGQSAPSWRGFHHEQSGVEEDEFVSLFERFMANLDGLELAPYMDFDEEQYCAWFRDCVTPVGRQYCTNPWRLIDIQPNGDANFCVDFPDYIIGNVKEHTIKELWNNERAARFRAVRMDQPFPVCLRCGSKYMSS